MLKGKQVMSGYNTLIKEALNAGDLGVAREALVSFDSSIFQFPIFHSYHVH